MKDEVRLYGGIPGGILIRRCVMGYNAKLAVHYVQLRITLTRLTSDYSERGSPLFDRASSVLLSSLRLRLFRWYLFIYLFSRSI